MEFFKSTDGFSLASFFFAAECAIGGISIEIRAMSSVCHLQELVSKNLADCIQDDIQVGIFDEFLQFLSYVIYVI